MEQSSRSDNLCYIKEEMRNILTNYSKNGHGYKQTYYRGRSETSQPQFPEAMTCLCSWTPSSSGPAGLLGPTLRGEEGREDWTLSQGRRQKSQGGGTTRLAASAKPVDSGEMPCFTQATVPRCQESPSYQCLHTKASPLAITKEAQDELMDVTLQWRLAFSKAPDTVAFMDDNTMQQISVQELLGSSTTLSGKLELYRFVC
ncbi:Protocadherin Alpha-7 [Manis pentadactyla]|nr:Protocadherin Alpha-7 [Manis pentadactyla]